MRFPDQAMVKVCGVANLEDAIFASEQGADIIGVVLDRTVARHGDPTLVSEIHSSGIRVAGVYTSLDAAIRETADEDLIQLHFDHGPSTVSRVKKETGKGVISVIQFSKTEGLAEQAESRYTAGADIVLLENRKGIIGTIGKMAEIQKRVKTGLSGRISISNVLEIAAANPLMIDLSSSLEEYPGKKDHALITELFRKLEVS